jgi:2-keto-3-deoxygluconate permease
MDMTNGGLYASLMNQYGTKEESGAFVLMSLESGPLMTMLILGSAGLATFEPHHFIGAVLPFLIGFALGNLDHDLRSFFSKATPVLIRSSAASGNTINLSVILDTGLLGILLGVALSSSPVSLIIADRVIGGERYGRRCRLFSSRRSGGKPGDYPRLTRLSNRLPHPRRRWLQPA